MHTTTDCLDRYDFYFSQSSERDLWYCYLCRCVISDTISSTSLSNEFITLPHFDGFLHVFLVTHRSFIHSTFISSLVQIARMLCQSSIGCVFFINQGSHNAKEHTHRDYKSMPLLFLHLPSFF